MQSSRRQFLSSTAAAFAAAAASGPKLHAQAAAGANAKLRVGVMGLSRGIAHVRGFAACPNVEIAYVCDVDERRVAKAIEATKDIGQELVPRGVGDFREILDDKSVDILSVATPNFWHAPATILGCAAGKHVYVEKPGSQNPHESQLMVEAAAKAGRHVQMGNQRRSSARMIEAIQRLREGAIGEVRYARCWYTNAREGIGKGTPAEVPAWLDYDLWQGPAPRRPYKDNLIHYNWHWHWHWGNGELGNNGIHALDLARWGLGVDYPERTAYLGGRYHFDDDQETPDTGVATFHFNKTKGATWEASSCHPRKAESLPFVSFYGDGGTLEVQSNCGYRLVDQSGMAIEKQSGDLDERLHFQNLCEVIRGDAKALTAPIADGQISTMLCHLGNIAYRTGTEVRFDAASKKIADNEAAMALWKRDYEPGWEPKL